MIPDSSWRYVYVSVVGSSHMTLGTPCQDASRVIEERTPDGTPVLLLMACDGAGSAPRAEVGARVAQETFWTDVCLHLRETTGGVAEITEAVGRTFIGNIRERLGREAAAEDRPLRDFAATFLASIVDPTCAVFMQVGDGVIVSAAGSSYVAPTWPQNGLYANMTYFLTDEDVLDHVQFTRHSAPVDEVAILTDGLQNLALHLAARAVHGPFFAPLFAALRAESPGRSTTLTPQLEAWLASPAVLARTDDDKTLILATRRASETPVP